MECHLCYETNIVLSDLIHKIQLKVTKLVYYLNLTFLFKFSWISKHILFCFFSTILASYLSSFRMFCIVTSKTKFQIGTKYWQNWGCILLPCLIWVKISCLLIFFIFPRIFHSYGGVTNIDKGLQILIQLCLCLAFNASEQ